MDFKPVTAETLADGLLVEKIDECLKLAAKSWDDERLPEEGAREINIKITLKKARNQGVVDVRIEGELKTPKPIPLAGRAQLSGTIGKLRLETFEREPQQIDIEDAIEETAGKSEIIDLDKRKNADR